MSESIPEYYFRTRENGALVFRVDGGNRMRRIEMEQIAIANIRNGEIKPQGGRDLTPEDLTRIRAWMVRRKEVLDARELDDIHRAVDFLHQTAQWVQSKATDADLDAVTEDLLLAMNDLRGVLVRKRAERTRP